MNIENVEIECNCLGLAHEFYTKDYVGIVLKLWAFAHLSLTMQEFASAIFLKSTSWTDQCLSTRYRADCEEHFSVFGMLLRFLCGLVSNDQLPFLLFSLDNSHLKRLRMYQFVHNLDMTELNYFLIQVGLNL